jgi:hypothetical protein
VTYKSMEAVKKASFIIKFCGNDSYGVRDVSMTAAGFTCRGAALLPAQATLDYILVTRPPALQLYASASFRPLTSKWSKSKNLSASRRIQKNQYRLSCKSPTSGKKTCDCVYRPAGKKLKSRISRHVIWYLHVSTCAWFSFSSPVLIPSPMILREQLEEKMSSTQIMSHPPS